MRGAAARFNAAFCTIINVQGRKSRYRTADDVEAIVRANAAQNVTRFFVTDDNFARNKNWEPILDRLIELRERDEAIGYVGTGSVCSLFNNLGALLGWMPFAAGGCCR